MVSEWTSSSFWHQTWRNLLINSRVLIIWINTCTNVRFKKLKMKPLNCIEKVIAEQTCMNGNICNWSFPHWYETFLGKLDFYKCPGFFFSECRYFYSTSNLRSNHPHGKGLYGQMFDRVHAAIDYWRELIVCLFLQKSSKVKGSRLYVIWNVQTAFLLCGAEFYRQEMVKG